MRTEKFVVSCVLWFVALFASASDPMPLAFEKTPLNEVIAMFSDASGIQVELPKHGNPLVSLDQLVLLEPLVLKVLLVLVVLVYTLRLELMLSAL